jgi:hypothetical protein
MFVVSPFCPPKWWPQLVETLGSKANRDGRSNGDSRAVVAMLESLALRRYESGQAYLVVQFIAVRSTISEAIFGGSAKRSAKARLAFGADRI